MKGEIKCVHTLRLKLGLGEKKPQKTHKRQSKTFQTLIYTISIITNEFHKNL